MEAGTVKDMEDCTVVGGPDDLSEDEDVNDIGW